LRARFQVDEGSYQDYDNPKAGRLALQVLSLAVL